MGLMIKDKEKNIELTAVDVRVKNTAIMGTVIIEIQAKGKTSLSVAQMECFKEEVKKVFNNHQAAINEIQKSVEKAMRNESFNKK